MSKASNFSFVDAQILRENLDIAFDHIIELVSLSESTAYSPILKSSFRKTIIIYTASIVEALLLLMLKKNKSEAELARKKDVFNITKEIYEVGDGERIVLGRTTEEIEKFRFDKVNLSQINALCKDHGLVTPELHDNVIKIRDLRNKQHIGSLKVIENSYSKQDLEFAFSVAKEVKELVKKGI